jgi:cell fate regulator YaaT (PSP1 superfamily)
VFIDLTAAPPGRGLLTNLAGVKFRPAGTIHEYDAGDASYQRGDLVVVESERGPILGTVAVASRRALSSESPYRILRRAGAEEDRQRATREKRERVAFLVCRARVRERRLPIKLVRAELPLQGSKITFYFASEERVDFRDLVKDLSQRLHGRVDLRQVGARDEAKMVGGIGDCGRELCCSTFLPAFAPISIKMAKDQGMTLNPTRVSGQCGRLKCCLVYEEDLYKEMRKGLPKVGKRVRTPAGEGRVVELDVLRRQVRVGFPFEAGGGTQTFPAESIELVNPPQPQGPGRGAPATATATPAPEADAESDVDDDSEPDEPTN